MNDNLDYFKNIDIAIEHFNNATNTQLIDFLCSDDEVLQQIALLKIDFVDSIKMSELICDKLTEHSSETREYCAFLINRLMKNENFSCYFKTDLILSKFTNAVSDVNPKVCRKIIEILPFYLDLDLLYLNLINNTLVIIDELKEKNKNKNYQYNTKAFHLYWHVFALGYTLNSDFYLKYQDKLLNIIMLLFDFYEYTIREKAAYLLNKIANFLPPKEAEILLSKYSKDDNFYVQEIFN